MKFTAFARKTGFVFSPGQLALARVAFDGESVQDVGGLAYDLFGNVEQIPDVARSTVTIVAGGRSGKTRLCALRVLHLCLFTDTSYLAPGEEAFAYIVAPRKDLSEQAVRYITGVLKAHPTLKARVLSDMDTTPEELRLVGHGGRTVTLKIISASEGGVSGRGRSVIGASLEECAFFKDDQYKVSDTEIFRAIAPRVISGGQLLVPSTPWGEAGLLWDLWKTNWNSPKSALVAHATTEVMRKDGPHWSTVKGWLDRERERDPDNFKREYDAEFVSGVANNFFDQTALEAAVRPAEMLFDPTVGAEITAGADFGFKHDSSALVIVQRIRGKVYASRIIELKPERGKPLVPSEVVKTFAAEMKRYGCKSVMADYHHRESLQEHLSAAGISMLGAPGGREGKTLVYNRAKEILYEGKLVLPDNGRLLRQLKDIVAKPVSGGGVVIDSPRWRTGGHGDIVSAFTLGLYQLAGAKITAEDQRSPAQVYMDKTLADIARQNREKLRYANRLSPVGVLQWNRMH